MTCPTCGATDMTDFCTECGEVFETMQKCNEKIIHEQSANYSRTTSELFTNNLKTGISQSDNLQSKKNHHHDHRIK